MHPREQVFTLTPPSWICGGISITNLMKYILRSEIKQVWMVGGGFGFVITSWWNDGQVTTQAF